MCAKFHCPRLTVTLFPGGVEFTPPHKKSKKPGLNRVKVSEIKGKVNHQARGIISEKKARFSVAYLIGYRPLVNQLYMQQILFFTSFSSTGICWESRILSLN